MKRAFQILSILSLVGWLCGFFIFNIGMPIHLCLAISLLLYIQSVITTEIRTETEAKTGFS